MAAVTHLRALQALELALRKGSLKAAADELAITPAALGQRIRGLEEYLGYDLLVRGRSGIRPTKELAPAVAHLGAGFRELETITEILDFQRVNEIHIASDPDWAELWLQPRLSKFREHNPNTLFCINGIGDVPVRLGDYDCEVHFREHKNSDRGETLFHDYLVPISSPENAERVLAQPNVMLEGFPLLHLDSYTKDAGDVGWAEWFAKYGYRKKGAGIGIRYQRVTHALEAVYANSGFMLCGLALVQAKVDAGVLTVPFPKNEGIWTPNAYQAYFRSSARPREPIERFKTWLLDESKQTAQALRQVVNPRVSQS